MAEFIIRKNEFQCNICIADNAWDTAVTAAAELVNYLGKQSKRKPNLSYDAPKAGDICVGAKSAACKEDELCLEVCDDILWVDGGKRGIIYAAYELLERLGFRFLTEDCEVIPEETELTVPENLQVCQNPIFEYRNTSWIASNVRTAPKMRLNAVLNTRIPDCWGGSLDYEGEFCHSLGRLAEMVPINGDYTDRQPCLTDENTFRTVVKNIREMLKKNPKARIISVSQNDTHAGFGGCQCEKCKAIDDAEGTPMGSLLNFVNRVAEELEPEFPNLAIDTLSYAYTSVPPKEMKARDSVCIRLCTGIDAVQYPIEVETPHVAENLKKWAQHSNRLYIWNYTTCFISYHNILPNFYILPKDVRLFADNNVKGVFQQGNHQTINGEFGELRAYLFGKLLWDPYMSEEEYEQHINDFIKGYYGKGWKHIRRFFDRIHNSFQGHVRNGNFMDPTKRYADNEIEGTHEEKVESFLKKSREDFALAKLEATSAEYERIKRAEIQLDLYNWYVCYNKWNGLADEDEKKAAAKKKVYEAGAVLYANVISSGITLMYESFESRGKSYFLDDMPDYMVEPFMWGNREPDWMLLNEIKRGEQFTAEVKNNNQE